MRQSTLKYSTRYYYDYHFYCFREYFEELKETSDIARLDAFRQHGATSRYVHSVAVAYYSYLLAVTLGKRAHLRDLVRGALTHDYYLYDCKEKSTRQKGHVTKHPQISLENAQKDFELTEIERDIITKHMFPLTLKRPRYRESVIVSLVDKGCAIYEFLKRKNPYPTVRYGILEKSSIDMERLAELWATD